METNTLSIELFDNKFADDFRKLNEEWILRYFELEQKDMLVLENPMAEIIEKGGQIFVALEDTVAIGVCAMINLNDNGFELAKMAVSPKAQGKGIGYLLGNAAVNWAKDQQAAYINLDSNRQLKAAISLYHKLGFEEQPVKENPYKRTDIHMVLKLK